MFTTPSVTDFQAQFIRDFNFAPAGDEDNQDFVMDADITNAINNALVNFNPGLFGDSAPTAFLWLAAFYLVASIQNSTEGLSSQCKFSVSSRNAGGVSVNFTLPEEYTKDPWLSSLTVNGYGQIYLTMLLPLIRGGISLVPGMTSPI